MKFLYKTAVAVGASLLPYIALAQSSVVQSVTHQATSFPQTNKNLSDIIIVFNKYINTLTPILASLAIICFFYGLIWYIYAAGDSKGREKGRQTIIWGLVGLFVIFSLWGILEFLKSVFLT